MKNGPKHDWKPWAVTGLLFVLCASLALLQNRWLWKLGDAEDARFHRDLQEGLDRFRDQFEGEIRHSSSRLIPSPSEIREAGIEKAVAMRSALHAGKPPAYFRQIALAVAEGGDVRLKKVELGSAVLVPMDWPPKWTSTHQELLANIAGRDFGPPHSSNPRLIEIPLHPGPRQAERDWLLFELDLSYLDSHTIPQLLARNLNSELGLEYEAEIASAENGGDIIFRSAPGEDLRRVKPDAWVSLLQPAAFHFEAAREGRGAPQNPPRPPPGLWRLAVRYKPGALKVFIVRAWWQNAAISGVLLALILATGFMLVRYSRKAQNLAELQFNFVAGISHELRTPVTIIRTASYNLHGEIAKRPDQVERYGAMIQAESEKLSAILEQILSFGSARRGTLAGRREETAVSDLIDQSISDSSVIQSGVTVETRVEPGLPPIRVDRTAFQQVLANLLSNAIKYGTQEVKWVGVFASSSVDTDGQAVAIRVVDRGSGIPREEQKLIFEPFFRGTHGAGQVRGTGLGLSLVRHIVESHGGSVSVKSGPATGTEFIVRLPNHPAT